MKLNCDLGEGFGAWQMGHDELIMPHIDMANIACGFHAGDPLIMQQTVALAKSHKVMIGAHPSYPDLQGFGRRSMAMSDKEITALVLYQIGALHAICLAQAVPLCYVKPHGALYNDMMKMPEVFTAVVKATSHFNQANSHSPALKLMLQALPNADEFEAIAEQYQVNLLFEAFADRNYQANGLLVPRSKPNAVIEDIELITKRVQRLITTGKLLAIDNTELCLTVNTICVHGDNQHAINIAKSLRLLLNQAHQ